jgi:hypothetical protein
MECERVDMQEQLYDSMRDLRMVKVTLDEPAQDRGPHDMTTRRHWGRFGAPFILALVLSVCCRCGGDDSTSSTGPGSGGAAGASSSSTTSGAGGTGGATSATSSMMTTGTGGSAGAGGGGGAASDGGVPCGATVCGSRFYCLAMCNLCCPIGAFCRCPLFDAGGGE